MGDTPIVQRIIGNAKRANNETWTRRLLVYHLQGKLPPSAARTLMSVGGSHVVVSPRPAAGSYSIMGEAAKTMSMGLVCCYTHLIHCGIQTDFLGQEHKIRASTVLERGMGSGSEARKTFRRTWMRLQLWKGQEA